MWYEDDDGEYRDTNGTDQYDGVTGIVKTYFGTGNNAINLQRTMVIQSRTTGQTTVQWDGLSGGKLYVLLFNSGNIADGSVCLYGMNEIKMSTLKVGTIADHTNGNSAITIDSSGNTSIPSGKVLNAHGHILQVLQNKYLVMKLLHLVL